MNPLELPEASPFPAGKSPFRQKGHVYEVTLRNLDGYVTGGAAATIERLADPELRAFLRQPFVAGSWYDVFPMIALVVQAARMRGVPYFRAVSDLSRQLAEAGLNGVYRAFMRVLSPELVAPRLPRLQAMYLDFGGVRSGASRPGYCEVFRTGHPVPLTHWYVAVVHGFMPYVLAEAGAKNPRVRWDPPVRDGAAHGVPTVTLRLELLWG